MRVYIHRYVCTRKVAFYSRNDTGCRRGEIQFSRLYISGAGARSCCCRVRDAIGGRSSRLGTRASRVYISTLRAARGLYSAPNNQSAVISQRRALLNHDFYTCIYTHIPGLAYAYVCVWVYMYIYRSNLYGVARGLFKVRNNTAKCLPPISRVQRARGSRTLDERDYVRSVKYLSLSLAARIIRTVKVIYTDSVASVHVGARQL